MPVEWTQDLSLGIPDLDAQHLEMDRHVGLLHDVRDGRREDLTAVLDGIRECMSRHFASEEAVMARASDPTLVAHHARHRDFMERLAAFEDRHDREGGTRRLAGQVAEWLAAWVREHQRFDLHVAAQVRKIGRMEAEARTGRR